MGDAYTTKTTAAGSLGTEIVLQNIQEEARAAAVISDKVTVQRVPRGSTAARFPKNVATLLSAGAISEGSEATAQAYSVSSVTVTPTIIGLDTLVTDLAEYTSIAAMPAAMQMAMARAIADKRETDILALSSGFTTSKGTTTVALSAATVQSAILALDVANAPRGNFGATFDEVADVLQDKILYLHPVQLNQLKTEIRQSNATWLFQEAAVSTLFNAANRPRGFAGTFLGVPVFTSTNVPTANVGADRLGMIIVPSAIGYAEFWTVRVQEESHLAGRAMRIGADTAYAVAELVDAYGVGVLSSAT